MENDKEKTMRQTLRETVKTTRYMLKFVCRDGQGKLYLFLKGVSALLDALFPLVYVVFPGLIINELSGSRRLDVIVLFVGLLAGLPVVNRVLEQFMKKAIYRLEMALELKHSLEFKSFVADMDYETLEDPEIQAMKERAFNTNDNMLNVANHLSQLASSVIGLVALSSIIVTLNPLLIALIVGVAYVNSLFSKRINYKIFLLNKEFSKRDSFDWAYYYMLERFEYAKEIRLFSIKNLLINILRTRRTKTNEMALDVHNNVNFMSTFTAVTNMLQQIALYAYVIYRVIARGLEIGSMTIYMSVASQFSNAIGQVFGAYINLSRVSLNIRELMDFFSIPSKHGSGDREPVFDQSSVIEFKNVSFKYPGSEVYALRNLNLTIRADEKLCIVGVNGSGKSTFVKLLTRLYLPAEGEILLNGVNIDKYDYARYQRLFAPVFQDFNRFYMTLRENIVLASEYDEKRFTEACEKSGLTELIKKLPKGVDTQVDKLHDAEGFVPSGGEEQRIAIARALYHNAPVYLLDEPTAALDPLAEYEIYTQFNEMINDKTAVLITHRLSAVQLADRVAVFDNGGLVEYGTHKQLYDRGALYKEMYDKQARFYINENETADDDDDRIK